ncbi:MAG TPA: MmcQ/YjbR family DNA-binding protein [Rhodanobacteraceae bacterium]
MTSDGFRRFALSLPEAIESAHMGHPDFRVGGKIFATLGVPDAGHGMVKLKPEQQELFMRAEPDVFAPAKGAWGRSGSTIVVLKRAKVAILRDAMVAAWRNVAPKRLAASLD